MTPDLKRLGDGLIASVQQYVKNALVPLHACYRMLEGRYAALDAHRVALDERVKRLELMLEQTEEKRARTDRAITELLASMRRCERENR